MARIKMTSGFTLMPEGIHVLKITEVKYDEDFGKLEIKLQNKSGSTLLERFSLMGNDGSPNEKALAAFSFFAKTAMNNNDLEDIDPAEMVGRFIRAEVVHNKQPSTKTPGQFATFANLGEKTPADGFDGDDVPAETPAETPAIDPSNIDLAALLG